MVDIEKEYIDSITNDFIAAKQYYQEQLQEEVKDLKNLSEAELQQLDAFNKNKD